jgi:hypothetical protein
MVHSKPACGGKGGCKRGVKEVKEDWVRDKK